MLRPIDEIRVAVGIVSTKVLDKEECLQQGALPRINCSVWTGCRGQLVIVSREDLDPEEDLSKEHYQVSITPFPN